jgi:hypothetical protein
MKRLTIDARNITPPNEADSDRLLDAMRNGWEGRPLIVRADGDGYKALTGAHRLAAAAAHGMNVPVLLVEDDDLDFDAWNELEEEIDGDDILAYLTEQGLSEVAEILEQERDFYTSRYIHFIRCWLRSA